MPVPRRAHALVRNRPGAEGLLLLRLPGLSATCSRSCRRPRASTSRARWSCSRTATSIELEREEEDPRDAEKRKRRERLLELLARTAAYYERCLWESEEAAGAREYLTGRGLEEATLREFRVGYAPSAWDRVLLASRRGGFSEQELYATGLAQRSKENGRPYDRFRARIMFPLADIRGRVLGFGARAMRAEQKPKYLNTSDNDLYHKGSHLYGADLARAHATKAGEVILCEGYTDVIALHQAGMRNAVAQMGTALTAEQVGELARMAQTVLLALDADTAGQEAMLRASSLAAKRKLELRVVPLPAGADPAELIQRDGPAAIEAAVKQSVAFVRFRVERALASGDDSTPEGRDEMLEPAAPGVRHVAAQRDARRADAVVSSRLALPENLAETLLASGPRGPPRPPRPRVPQREYATSRAKAHPPRRPRRGRDPSGREDTERAFLALCIAAPRRVPWRSAVSTSTSTSPARCCAAPPGGCATATCASRCRPPPSPGAAGGGERAEQAARRADRRGRARASRTRRCSTCSACSSSSPSVDRQIQQARGQDGGDINDLAKRKADVKREFDTAVGKVLEESGDRG